MRNYQDFLHSLTAEKWKSIGTGRRSGVVIPLFSIFSRSSIGIGEIPDLDKAVDWCRECGFGIIQLLPLNDFGSYPAPYNAVSTFALEPAYISVKKLRDVPVSEFSREIKKLRKIFPKRTHRVDYRIKNYKTDLLKKIFLRYPASGSESFKRFISDNEHWMKYYVLFKIISNLQKGKNWEEWDFRYKYISPLITEKLLEENLEEKLFNYWVQWQLYEQLISAKKYANDNGVLIMGDLPFLVSRNSADVWAYKNYFKLDLSSGAPPDMYFASGQRWGMPPYDWTNIAADDFIYIRQRLKYAENFYNMFRIDHFIGLFRLWTIDLRLPAEYGGLYGKFDPEDEQLWEEHGKRILYIMNDSTSMLPCAEDLGTVPHCSDKVLMEFGIPGIEVQRWKRKWYNGFNFVPSGEYRINSVAVTSTHDSSFLPQWWNYEAGTIDEVLFTRICEKLNIDPEKIKKVLFDREQADLTGSKRLCWNSEIRNVDALLKNIDRSYDEAYELVKLFLSSFDEKEKFLGYIGAKTRPGQKASVSFVKKTLDKVSSASSIFSIQILMDWLYLDKGFLRDYSDIEYRINYPGIVSDDNWSIRIKFSLEQLKMLPVNKVIRKINLVNNRS